MDRPPAILAVEANTTAHVCAWCDGKEAAARWYKAQNLRITHGICPRCRERFALPEKIEQSGRCRSH